MESKNFTSPPLAPILNQSSNSLKIDGFLGSSIMSIVCWLSLNAILLHSIPSFTYSSCSRVNICQLNCYCSFSFAQLMHNCSKEFDVNISKPKISRSPMNCRLFFFDFVYEDPYTDMAALTFCTIQEKIQLQSSLHKESLS